MRKFRVVKDLSLTHGLKIGDIVTLVEGSVDDDLYELPEHLHGKGHDGGTYDHHLGLKEKNYTYLYPFDLQEIIDTENIIIAINIFSRLFPDYEITKVELWDETDHYISYKIYAIKYKDLLTEVINIEK